MPVYIFMSGDCWMDAIKNNALKFGKVFCFALLVSYPPDNAQSQLRIPSPTPREHSNYLAPPPPSEDTKLHFHKVKSYQHNLEMIFQEIE